MAEADGKYLDCVIEKLEAVRKHPEQIDRAAQAVYSAISGDGYLYVFGTGHSHMFAEELFYRAGGLARVKPILNDALMLHIRASKSTIWERQRGLAEKLLQQYGVTGRDVVLIASNSGRNAVTVEMAQKAKQIGAVVIALTSLNHSKAQASRSADGRRLFEVADIVLDNFGEVGDACIQTQNGKVAATSTVVGCAILEAMVARVVELSQNAGQRIETFSSSNVDGGDAINQAIIDKYGKEIPIL